METAHIYKIFRMQEWTDFKRDGLFRGSPDDIRDGYIHFSSVEQLQGTLDKYFKDEPELVIAYVEAEAFEDKLKWEASRGGALFPHLYGVLHDDAVMQYWLLKPDSSGAYHLPDVI